MGGSGMSFIFIRTKSLPKSLPIDETGNIILSFLNNQ